MVRIATLAMAAITAVGATASAQSTPPTGGPVSGSSAQIEVTAPPQAGEAQVVVRVEVRPGPIAQHVDPNFDARVARPAYTESHPRVLFDEAHHNFHTAGARYRPFTDLIAGDGYQVTPNRGRFTPSKLAKADILVVVSALGAEGMRSPGAERPAFTDEECRAVRDWVHDGGSLLLITDIPPTGSAAAGLAGQFEVEMGQNVVVDPKNSRGAPGHLVFSRENRLLGDHPITWGRDESERVALVLTFAGQSLVGPEGSVGFLKLGETATDRGASGPTPAPAAGRSQGLALSHGKGRVVVLGEAGQLSAQLLGPGRAPMGMNVPGADNRQLALNIMHWLSGLLYPTHD